MLKFTGVVLVLTGLLSAGPVWAQPARGEAQLGKALFQSRCGMCHTAAVGDGDGGQGPPLKGVVGRKAASAPGFRDRPVAVGPRHGHAHRRALA